MRPKTIILLVLALGCGLVASVGISQMLQRNQDNGPPSDTAPVWVAKSDIKADESLTMQNLQLEQWPKEKIPPGALSKMEEITDKRARVNLYQGEPVLGKKLLGKDESTAGSEIPKGWRLYTVIGDAISSHGGLLHPGDRVDVLVFVQKGNAGIETGTKTILQDIKVFAVNDQVHSSEEKGSESITAKTVTLLVTPSAAEKLALANEIGKIRLVMRGLGDEDTVNPAGTQIGTLFGVEKMDRGSEDTNRPPTSPQALVPSLTALLDSQAHKASPPPEPLVQAPADEQFNMQVIKGTEVSEEIFKRKFDDPTHWANNSSGSEDSGDSKPAPATPPADAAKPKAPSAKAEDGSPKEDSRQGSPATHS